MYVTLDRVKLPNRTTNSHATQRGIGALVGAAVGDALGAPYEFGCAGQLTAGFPDAVLGGCGEMIGGGLFGWAPAEFTDDTQMAVVLAESMLEHHAVDSDALFTSFVAWARTARDVGVATRRALSFPSRVDAVAATGLDPRGAGNGALMRVAPVAMAFFSADRSTAMLAATSQAAVTHGHPAAGWGAAIQVELLRAAMRGEDPLAAIDDIVAVLPEPHRTEFAEVLSPSYRPGASDGPRNGSVWTCLADAVWANRQGRTFAEVVRLAVDIGGDTDTVGAVAGALAGARFGASAIPSRWATYVHGVVDGRTYRLADLQELARRLMGAGVSAEAPLESTAGPTEVAPGLFAANLTGAAEVPTDWAVVSLCRTGSRFADHPVRRELFLFDDDRNLDPLSAVGDAVDSIEAFLAEGRHVVVHCHGGRSRTGLVLKAWAMRTYGFSEADAHDWVVARWPLTARSNPAFTHLLTNDWKESH
jgi:ADP-ribosyl-[dinitrogen reductase] hydrolase